MEQLEGKIVSKNIKIADERMRKRSIAMCFVQAHKLVVWTGPKQKDLSSVWQGA